MMGKNNTEKRPTATNNTANIGNSGGNMKQITPTIPHGTTVSKHANARPMNAGTFTNGKYNIGTSH